MMKGIVFLGFFLWLVSTKAEITLPQFPYRIAIIGNPAVPDARYDTCQLKALKELGFNAIQLNIAWGARPADEALNLEDILYMPGKGKGSRQQIEKRLATIKERAETAKKWGFRTLFHFGAPNVDSLYRLLRPDLIDGATEKNSITKKEIVESYVNLLKRLHKEIPAIDDVQIYTFDQEAWVGNEFGEGISDKEIPLHERLPSFLRQLTETWAQLNPHGMLWWEPWELSAGQIYACIPHLPTKNFGLFMHSNIAEVQLSRPVDVWFRNMVNLLKEKEIPVVGELFLASANEEVEPLQHLAAPRLVYEELASMYNVDGVSGIKEYFGLLPDQYDPSLSMAGLKIKQPDISLAQAIDQLAEPYGATAGPWIREAWESTAKGLQLFPWDATWRFRYLPKNAAGIDVFHRWDKAWISGAVAPSPSWKSTRRSLFMITEEEILDPWLFEDVELRAQAGADHLVLAIQAYQQVDKILPPGHPMKDHTEKALADARMLEEVMRAIQCYCREANLAFLMRKYTDRQQAIPQTLIKRFATIMKIDADNQSKGYVKNEENHESAKYMLNLFEKDPALWVRTYLLR